MSFQHAPALISVASILPVLGIASVALRFYIRKQQKQGLAADDWLILPALLFTIGAGVCILYGVSAKVLGYPTQQISLAALSSDTILSEQLQFAIFILQAAALGFTKLSITCFYRRIFNTGSNRKFNIFTILLLVFISGWALTWILAYIFGCGTRVYLQWAPESEEEGYCTNDVIKESFFVATDIVVDVILFIMPIPLIIRLQMSKLRRFALAAVFCFGALTVVASILRTTILALLYSGEEGNALALADFGTADPDLEISIFFFWTMLEIGLAVIVACLPSFVVLFRYISTDTAFKHVRGIISMMSLSSRLRRKSRKSSDDASIEENFEARENGNSTIRARTEHYTVDSERL